MAQQRKIVAGDGQEKTAPGMDYGVSQDPSQMFSQLPTSRMRMPNQPEPGGGIPWDEAAQSQTKPREMAGGGAAPARPRSPQPSQGAVTMPLAQGLLPFQPMGGPGMASMASPKRGGLYGSLGGLKGGGLGVPLDPINDAQEDPLSGLIAMLMGKRG